jgi:hypothetical protein
VLRGVGRAGGGVGAAGGEDQRRGHGWGGSGGEAGDIGFYPRGAEPTKKGGKEGTREW